MAEDAPRRGHSTDAAVQLVIRFNDALNARNVDAMLSLLAGDIIFENTYPAPDGTRYEGQASVRAFWEDFFHNSHQPRIEIEEIFGLGDRCIMRFVYHWEDPAGKPGYVRGVDLYRVRGGQIAEKLSYVKG